MNADATILAFDPGGTKCHALLVSGDGQPLGWGTGEGPGLSGRSDKAFTGCAIANALVCEVVAKLVQAGIQLPIFMSANREGGDDWNAQRLAENKDRIYYL